MAMTLSRIVLPGLGLMLMMAAQPAMMQAQEEATTTEEEAAPKPKPKKKVKDKGYDYEKSKYKAFRVDPEPSVYKFDASGRPILPEKKKAPAKKKPMTVPEDEDCQSDDSCKDAEKS
jgi:hypothetical protein